MAKDAYEQDISWLAEDAFLESVFEDDSLTPPSSEILEVFEIDRLIEQSVYEGPLVYLGTFRQGVNQYTTSMRQALYSLRTGGDKQEQGEAYATFGKGRDWLIWANHSCFPKPPFPALARKFPVRRHLLGFIWLPTGFTWNHVNPAVHSLIHDAETVKWYITITEPLPELHRRQYFGRFCRWLIVEPCRRRKRARFLQAVNRLILATGEIGAFLESYMDHHLFNLEIRSQFGEPPHFG